MALILCGTARFLAAHTPTRRELPQVVRIASRLRRGEVLFAYTAARPEFQAISARQGESGPMYLYARVRPELKVQAGKAFADPLKRRTQSPAPDEASYATVT